MKAFAALVTALMLAAPAAAATTERVSVSSSERQGNGMSYGAALYADGRFVAFTSTASNFVTL